MQIVFQIFINITFVNNNIFGYNCKENLIIHATCSFTFLYMFYFPVTPQKAISFNTTKTGRQFGCLPILLFASNIGGVENHLGFEKVAVD